MTKVHIVKAVIFLWPYVTIWELDHKEGRTPKNRCLQTVVVEKTPESPLDSKIKPVNLKGNQPWILAGKTDTEVEASVFWSSDANSWLIGKVPDGWKEGEEGVSGWDAWMASLMQKDMNLAKLWETVRDMEAFHAAVHSSRGVRHDWVTEKQQMVAFISWGCQNKWPQTCWLK